MKFIVNSHTYQGLAGETTDCMEFYDSFTDAKSEYDNVKDNYCDYNDSFVQLFVVENENCRLALAYYAERYADENEYEKDRFHDGEYVNEKLLDSLEGKEG